MLKNRPFSWARLIPLILILMVGFSPPARVAGQPRPHPGLNTTKIDPLLLERMNQAGDEETLPVIVRMEHPAVQHANPRSNARRAADALDRIRGVGGQAGNSLAIVGGASGQMTRAQIAQLSRDPFVSYISLDAEITPAGPLGAPLASLYTEIVRAPEVWALGYTGQGITIAVVDSGIAPVDDFMLPNNRVVASVDFTTTNDDSLKDPGGHGTHVAGIAAGNGYQSSGTYKGIAPGANLAMVRVIKSNGKASISTVIRGIQWVVHNRDTYNIRVLNLSLGAPSPGSYRQDPLSAAVEMAWFSGVVVVAAAGNHGPSAGTVASPGADPFLITVGALDDSQTLDTADDLVPFFSSRGPTPDAFTKPDVVAPGRKMVSLRALSSFLDIELPGRRTATHYFRLTGTSMAAPVVSGIVALMLEKDPSLTPNQVKAVLKASARPVGSSDANTAGAGLVDAYAAVTSPLVAPANQGLIPSDVFAEDILPLVRGAPLTWRDPYYMGIDWSNITWDNITWDNITWDASAQPEQESHGWETLLELD